MEANYLVSDRYRGPTGCVCVCRHGLITNWISNRYQCGCGCVLEDEGDSNCGDSIFTKGTIETGQGLLPEMAIM